MPGGPPVLPPLTVEIRSTPVQKCPHGCADLMPGRLFVAVTVVAFCPHLPKQVTKRQKICVNETLYLSELTARNL